jgi:hypothetical protein
LQLLVRGGEGDDHDVEGGAERRDDGQRGRGSEFVRRRQPSGDVGASWRWLARGAMKALAVSVDSVKDSRVIALE